VRRLVGLYGAALGRVLSLVEEAGRMDEAFESRLCEDELVASLLALHGLHPLPFAVRVARAVEELKERLGVRLELLETSEEGALRLRISFPEEACPSSSDVLRRTVEREIVEVAPEVTRIEILGLPEAPAPVERLVSIRPLHRGTEAGR